METPEEQAAVVDQGWGSPWVQAISESLVYGEFLNSQVIVGLLFIINIPAILKNVGSRIHLTKKVFCIPKF